MSKFTYETQGTSTYLIYEVGSDEKLDSMSVGMLVHNTVPGFAATSFTQRDATRYIRYNVSAKVSIAQLFAGPVNKKRLVGVISGVVKALLAAEDYMIDTNSILLDHEHIFTDVSTGETVVICLPVENIEWSNPDLCGFLKNIIFSVEYDQTENSDYVVKILNYLNGTTAFSLEGFKDVLDGISREKGAQPRVQPVVPQPVVQKPVAVSPVPQNNVPVAAPKAPPAPPIPNVMDMPVVDPLPGNTGNPNQSDEKPMSWLYLMQHYNKENAALYKAQKANKSTAKKAKGANAQALAVPNPAMPNPAMPSPTGAAPKRVAAPLNGYAGIAIPGQPAVPKAAPVPVPAAVPVPAPGAQKPVNPPVAVAPPQPAKPVYAPPVMPQPAMNFGETTVLNVGDDTKTIALGTFGDSENKPHLIRKKNNEKIDLNKPVFRIGKEKSYADYCIGDNTAISRSHANILSRGGEYFVVDTNSTNHTFVNGQMISSNVETKISHGTQIKLANEEFEFRIF